MVIDLRRIRRGRTEQHLQRWKLWTVAAVAVVAQSTPGESAAQASTGNNGGAPRDPWRLSTSIGVDETYSDNINLSPAGSERSEFVTSISPSLHLTRLSPRVTVNLDYAPQYLVYARGSNGNSLRNTLAAAANAQVIENLLTFDAAANVSQQNVSPFGTQAANSVNGSTNRAETRTYSFGPTLRSRFGQDLSYDAGYRFAQSSSDNNAYATSHTSQVFGDFSSSTSFRDLGFGGNFIRSEQDYGGANSIVTETVGSTLTYVVSPTFHLRGNVGYDRSSYPTTDQPDLKGLSYSGGFDWQPSRHTSFNLQVGKRYFGPTANITLSQTTNRFAINAVYSRDQTTSNAAGTTLAVDPNYALLDQIYRATITDPIARAAAVVSTLTQLGLPVSQYGTAGFLSNQIYVQKRAAISVALLGLRNTVTFDVSRSESQSLSAITTGFDIFNTTNQFQTTQYSANWSHKLGPRTSAAMTAQKVRNTAIEGIGDTRQRVLTASINRQFTQHLNGSLLYRNTTQTSDNPGAGFYSGNYRENSLLGSLRLTF